MAEENLNLESARPKPTMLIILDGWGVASDSPGNAISRASTPNFDKYCQNYFCTTLQASGESVGLGYNEMGNSEVGHLNIGAGKIVYQNFSRINKSITDKEFFYNPAFVKACENSLKNKTPLHLMGLISSGGVHASIDHLYALLELASHQGIKDVFVHAFLDGRDMAYNSALDLIKSLEAKMKELGVGKIATVSGRWWAMDRDNRWDRTQAVYNALTTGQAENTSINAAAAIEKSYENKIYDEEFKPTVITDKAGNSLTQISNKSSIVFFNFRADRARQLTKAFTLPSFDKFERPNYLQDLFFVTMTEYDKDLPVEVAYAPEIVKNPLAKIISDSNLKQLHVAETEKYAHVTYFLDGGQEEPFPGEDRVLIPSPSVENYVETPEMSAHEIKERILKELSTNKYDFIAINFANPDMVGHTGDLPASIKAVETVDKCLGEIVESVLSLNGVLLVTADHGNVEEVIKMQTGEIDKEHSTNPVPCLIIGADYATTEPSDHKIDLNLLTPSGVLADIAPTILKIMNLAKPEDMTGRSLI